MACVYLNGTACQPVHLASSLFCLVFVLFAGKQTESLSPTIVRSTTKHMCVLPCVVHHAQLKIGYI